MSAVGKLRRAIAIKGLLDDFGRGMRVSVGWAAEDQIGQLVLGLVSQAVDAPKVVAGDWLDIDDPSAAEVSTSICLLPLVRC